MLFKKNKITQGIKDSATNDTQVSGDFETLDSVKQRKKSRNWFNRLIIQQYHDGVENVKGKCAATKTYFQKNWLKVIQFFMIVSLCISFVMGLCILFEPFNGIMMITGSGYTNGNVPVPINNMYTLSLGVDGVTHGLTGLGIAFTVFVCLWFVLSVVWFIFKLKNKSLLCNKSKATKIISIIAYVLVMLGFLAVVVIAYIPPTTASLTANGQIILENRQVVLAVKNKYDVITNATSQEKAAVIQAVVNLHEVIGKGTLSASPTFEEAMKWFNSNQQWFWPSYQLTSSYAFYLNLYTNLPSTINTAGYCIICFTSIFFILGLIVLPLTNEVLKIKEEIEFNAKINVDFDFEAMKQNMNTFKRMIATFIARAQNSIFKKISQMKNKDSFRKYKKEMNEKGMSATQQKDSFKSDVTENTVTFVITKEEIEKHEPNKAFLNSQGQYMYHDGNHNYFIVKNDAWVPFDINQGVHQAQVNITSNRNTDVSNKHAKEHKWFKNNKLFNKISEKTSKNKAAIDLPDEELNKKISELDI